MESSSLQVFKTEEGIEVVVDMSSGETWATVSGYARMSGKDKSTISRRKGVESDKVKEAEIPTKGGTQGVALIPESTILEWLEKDNSSLLTQFAKLGLRMTLHKWAGVDFTQKKPELQPKHPEQPELLEPEREPSEINERFKVAKMIADLWSEWGVLSKEDRLFLKNYTRESKQRYDMAYEAIEIAKMAADFWGELEIFDEDDRSSLKKFLKSVMEGSQSHRLLDYKIEEPKETLVSCGFNQVLNIKGLER